MKVRTGFVSNSSSSSFVAGFKTIPRSIEDVKHMLFGDSEWYCAPYDDEKYSTERVAETVFNDMKNKRPLTLEEFLKATDDMADIDYDDERFKIKGKGSYDTTDWDKLHKFQKQESAKMAKEFLEANKDYYFYEFSYADENGSYDGALEHGGLFDNVPSIRMSHH